MYSSGWMAFRRSIAPSLARICSVPGRSQRVYSVGELISKSRECVRRSRRCSCRRTSRAGTDPTDNMEDISGTAQRGRKKASEYHRRPIKRDEILILDKRFNILVHLINCKFDGASERMDRIHTLVTFASAGELGTLQDFTRTLLPMCWPNAAGC